MRDYLVVLGGIVRSGLLGVGGLCVIIAICLSVEGAEHHNEEFVRGAHFVITQVVFVGFVGGVVGTVIGTFVSDVIGFAREWRKG